jgi:hypothetical protein
MLAVPGDEIYGPLPEGEASGGKLAVVLELVADGAALMTCGAYLDGKRLHADTLHNQLFTLPDNPTSMALNVTGTPEQLADQAADWFESWLTVPLVRQEWDSPDGSVFQTWGRGDTGQGYISRGRFRRDLGSPDRTVLISGDASRLSPDNPPLA